MALSQSSDPVEGSGMTSRYAYDGRNGFAAWRPVVDTQHQLFSRYSSSQHYFYSNKVTQIIKEKCVPANLMFEDIECWLDEQEYLKRQYHYEEYSRKLSTFKEYYFYHEDCPRVFGNPHIADTYEKWHEKKRDYVYKKLKFMYNETYSSMDSSEKSIEEGGGNALNITHFLLDISEYNPFSKNYYLRVQARKEKERIEKLKQMQKQKQDQSADLMTQLNHQLSTMIHGVSHDLSELTLSDERIHKLASKYNSNGKAEITSPNKTPGIKFNFKKKEAKLQAGQEENKIGMEPKEQPRAGETQSNFMYIDTQGSQRNSKGNLKHKKYTSEVYQLGNNLNKNDSKIRSILLMSSSGSKNLEPSVKYKLGLLKFGSEGPQVKKGQEPATRENRVFQPINTFNAIKTYKSLQRFDNPVLNGYDKYQWKPNSQIKYSHSISKLTRLSPSKQGEQGEAAGRKVQGRQSSLKQPGWDTHRQNLQEQFNDRQLMGKGLISYKSERIDPTASTSASTELKTRIAKHMGHPQIKLSLAVGEAKSTSKNNEMERHPSQKKGNIRITLKNNNLKQFNNK